MTIFNDPQGKVIDVNADPILQAGWIRVCGTRRRHSSCSIASPRCPPDNVGVLTLFGRVTGEVLAEGIHLINPLKTNNEMSIQTQTIKESASVPSSEGLVMNLDTSLIYHLNPERAADVYQKIGGELRAGGRGAELARRDPRGDGFAYRQCPLHRRARNGGQTDQRPAHHGS